MPYIRVATTRVMSAEQQLALKDGLARAVELIPGKDESKLMVELAGGLAMYYRGAAGEFAFIDAKFSGAVDFADKKRFTETALAVCEQVLDLRPGDANLTFSCYDEWGIKGTLLAR